MRLIKALFRRRWLGGTVLVLFAVALFIRLGIWQLARLEERRGQNAELSTALAAPPLDLSKPLPGSVDELENRLATAAGRYDYSQERILLLQTWQGRTGVRLVTPLLIEGVKDTAVLVNRGWVTQQEFEDGLLDQYRTEEMGQVDGYLALSQPGRPGSATDAATEIYRIDIEALASELPYELLPVILVEAPEDRFDLEPPFRSPREVDLSEGPHLSYAWQWFIFAVLTGTLYLVFVRRSEQQRSSPNELI